MPMFLQPSNSIYAMCIEMKHRTWTCIPKWMARIAKMEFKNVRNYCRQDCTYGKQNQNPFNKKSAFFRKIKDKPGTPFKSHLYWMYAYLTLIYVSKKGSQFVISANRSTALTTSSVARWRKHLAFIFPTLGMMWANFRLHRSNTASTWETWIRIWTTCLFLYANIGSCRMPSVM